MCFFDQHRFVCGDWKWGNFQQHCSKEYRIGETCGMKLIGQVIPIGTKCKLCEKIDTKMRRRTAEIERINRWRREGREFQASIDRSMETIRSLDEEMRELTRERNRRLQAISALGRDDGNGPSPGRPTQANPPPSVGALTSTDGNTFLGANPTQVFDTEEEDINEREENTVYKLIDKQHGFFGLPITFESIANPATVMAVPDTGAQENVISLDLAFLLGLYVDMSQPEEEKLTLINGRILRCCGTAKARCGFGKTSHIAPSGLHCTFRVLPSAISPLIMSRKFLEQTQTFSKYRHRLIKIAKSTLSFLGIRSLGETQERLLCSLNGKNVEALPDSGSDVDIISHDYATKNGLSWASTEETVILADGTVVKANGICTAQLAVGFDAAVIGLQSNTPLDGHHARQSADDEIMEDVIEDTPEPVMDAKQYRNIIQTKFYILGDITVDVLIGAGSLESLDVYTNHMEALVTRNVPISSFAPLHRIVLVGDLGQMLRNASKRCLEWFQNSGMSLLKEDGMTFEQILNESDQRENARREVVRDSMAKRAGEARQQLEVEERERRAGYDEYRQRLLQAHQMSRRGT